jgi:hypothetical protein
MAVDARIAQQLREGAAQIALKDDFQNPGLIDNLLDFIADTFGIDLRQFFDTVDGIIAPITSVVNQVIDVFNGLVVTPINAAISGLISWFTGNNTDRASALSKANSALSGLTAKANQTDLAELQSKTDKLEGVIGYAHAYCPGGFSMSAGDMAVPMTIQIGPSAGATVSGAGSIFLNSKGLWVADAQITVDFLNIGVVYTNMQIRVYTPGGSLYAQRIAEADSGEKETLSVHMPFTVPTSGYYVQVWANAALGRGIKGGSVWNGLSLDKRSTETT